MIDLYKFWLGTQEEDFTLNDVPTLLRDSIMYTYGDAVRIADIRYNDSDTWVASFKQPMFFAKAVMSVTQTPAYCLTVADGTASKLGIVTIAGSDDYARYHAMFEIQGMRAAIAKAFGYDDVVLISGDVGNARVYVADGTADDYRTGGLIPSYSTFYANDTYWWSIDSASKPAPASVIGAPLPGGNLTQRTPIIMRYIDGTIYVEMPIEHFHTDAENTVTLNSTCDALLENRLTALTSDVSDKIDTLTLAFASVADLAGTISVFGNTVRDVANKYNNVAQYIPRP